MGLYQCEGDDWLPSRLKSLFVIPVCWRPAAVAAQRGHLRLETRSVSAWPQRWALSKSPCLGSIDLGVCEDCIGNICGSQVNRDRVHPCVGADAVGGGTGLHGTNSSSHPAFWLEGELRRYLNVARPATT